MGQVLGCVVQGTSTWGTPSRTGASGFGSVDSPGEQSERVKQQQVQQFLCKWIITVLESLGILLFCIEPGPYTRYERISLKEAH